ncbi:MAG: HEAT repeat domain-containing protein [Planctomycetota bacterium]|nr:HEAT repeat domain-containing protein [Planctomycetota bacterium]MDA1177317.1 HEAT repeat domain-containing protein [Planctomycetota bacterium]
MTDPLPTPPPQIARREEALPPVQPPTAGFLVQLFLIPFLIVSVVVSVWFALHWLAHMGSNPDEMVAQLESLDSQKRNDHAWQVANDLAVVLSGRDSGVHRRNPALARRLGAILQRECKRDRRSDERVELQVFLCTTLGQFEVPDAIEALLGAVAPDQPPTVRQAAIEAFAMLGSTERVGPVTMRETAAVVAALRQASQTFAQQQESEAASATIRSRSAYALGVIGGPQVCESLIVLLSDPFEDARYNAAAGLARQGDVRAIPHLLKMLEPPPTENEPLPHDAATPTKDDKSADWKRHVVWETALSSIDLLLKNPDIPKADLLSLQQAAEVLAQSSGGAIRLRAGAILRQLQVRAAANH